MASQRGAKPSAPVQPADAASSATPAPFATLRATLTELPKGQVLRQDHQDQRRADQFNPGARGNARFSPIRDDRRRPIPMLHGGATMDCALMETVFHDAPDAAGFKTFDKGKPAGLAHLTIEVAQPLAKTAANGLALASRRDGLRAWRRLFCCDAILWLRASAGSAGKGMGTAGCLVFRVENGRRSPLRGLIKDFFHCGNSN